MYIPGVLTPLPKDCIIEVLFPSTKFSAIANAKSCLAQNCLYSRKGNAIRTTECEIQTRTVMPINGARYFIENNLRLHFRPFTVHLNFSVLPDRIMQIYSFMSLHNRLCVRASADFSVEINLFLIIVTSYFPILQITAKRMQSATHKAGKRS